MLLINYIILKRYGQWYRQKEPQASLTELVLCLFITSSKNCYNKTTFLWHSPHQTVIFLLSLTILIKKLSEKKQDPTCVNFCAVLSIILPKPSEDWLLDAMAAVVWSCGQSALQHRWTSLLDIPLAEAPFPFIATVFFHQSPVFKSHFFIVSQT